MRAILNEFESGASGLSLELSTSEIDSLIEALLVLKRDPEWHFHYRSSFEEPGIGDIEISNSGNEKYTYLELVTGEVIYPK